MFTDQELHHLLKRQFGFDTFRSPQLEVIKTVLSGRDAFALMPTGAGKSLCYQLPALMLPGLTLVISPLISLMKNQVDVLRQQGLQAEYINSAQSVAQLRKIAVAVNQNSVKILYLSPERLAVERFEHWIVKKKISLIAVDEAHCISEWGHDFRPDYTKLSRLKILFKGVPILAVTATAIPQARKDIVTLLRLENPALFQTSFNRPNLHYIVRATKEPWEELMYWLHRYTKESVVIYCLSRRTTNEVATELCARGFFAAAYHAGLPKEERNRLQDEFLTDKTKIIVATIAFGMGIDKPNVRLVVHYDLPKSLEGYYQETGRAGRDGLVSHCVLFFQSKSISVHQNFFSRVIDPTQKKIQMRKLSQMIAFCETKSCRRRWILQYFQEPFSLKNCQGCDCCVRIYQEKQLPEQSDEKGKYLVSILEALKLLRLELSRKHKVPAFVIFSDLSLIEMATYLPTNIEEFGKIVGVGAYKKERYGRVFTASITKLCLEQGIEPNQEKNSKQARVRYH